MVELISEFGSTMDDNLAGLWSSSEYRWRNYSDFIKELDPENIIGASFSMKSGIRITFKDEESKMFFILKYS